MRTAPAPTLAHIVASFALALVTVLGACGGSGAHPGGDAGTGSDLGPGDDARAGGDSGGPAVAVIGSFAANPATLPEGGGSTTLSWSVTGATSIALDQGVGPVSGTSRVVTPTATTTYTLTATNDAGTATASVTVLVGSSIGINPPGGGRYAALIAPVDGETFVGPLIDLRLIGVGHDDNNWEGTGPGGGHSQAASVQFLVDGTGVLTVDASSSEYHVFKGFATGLALSPGDHTVTVRATYSTNPGPAASVDSRPVTITVQPAPTYGQTVDMSGDLSLAQAASWVGTAASRIRVNGNGHRILAPASSSAVNWQFVDFYSLGDPSDTAANGIDVTTTGNITIQNCRFDYSNPVQFSLGGTATADVRGNLFRSNMRQPLGQLPYGDSYPVVNFRGGSTAAKVFAGNNVGAGWVDFQSVDHWTVGGDTDADSNVLVGPRVGIHFDYQGGGTSTNIVIKRNYSDHIYYGGWSQGNNLEGGGNSSLLAENNILIGSSWTIRGMAGEFRYNLVLMGGEDWMWVDTGAYVHHNVFVGGDNNRSGIYNTYGNTGIRILNNTFDGMDGGMGINAILVTGSEALTSNLFMNMPYTAVDLEGGALQSDYNLFWECESPYYSDARTPVHDVHADPLLTNPAAHQFEFSETSVWKRTLPVRDILAAYRAKYMPRTGSPVIDSGDPGTFGAGNDIGAVGNGTASVEDLFGK